MDSNTLAQLSRALDKIQTTAEKTEAMQEAQGNEINTLKKVMLSRGSNGGGKGPNDAVTEGCALFLAGVAIQAAETQGKLREHPHRETLLRGLAGCFNQPDLRLEIKSSLTTTDIPLPASYGQEVVELVWKYGQARQYSTLYPLGAGTNRLPRLKTSPAFGFMDMSEAIPEKAPQVEYVEFNAKKAGGLVRLPAEIEEDNLVGLGQFLARYFARELAKWEDTVAFLADGTSTYKSISGVSKKADTLGKKVQLGATKTAPSDITLTDLRTLRGQVDAAALRTAAYYCHPTHESRFVQFNTLANGTVYIPNSPGGMSTLDGFPIRAVGVMPVYDQTAHASQYQVLFGDLSFYYLGVRGTPDLAVSRDVFFATDEIALRGLERFDWQCMADSAMAVLQLAAA